jgi:hypothetical protein
MALEDLSAAHRPNPSSPPPLVVERLSNSVSMFPQPRPTPRSSAIFAELLDFAATADTPAAETSQDVRTFAASSMLNLPPAASFASPTTPTSSRNPKQPLVPRSSVGRSSQQSNKQSGDRTSFALSEVIVSPFSDTAAEPQHNTMETVEEEEKILDIRSDDDDENEDAECVVADNAVNPASPVVVGAAAALRSGEDPLSPMMSAEPLSCSVAAPSEAFFECVSSFSTPAVPPPGMQSLAAQFAELQQLASYVIHGSHTGDGDAKQAEDLAASSLDDASPDRRSSSMMRLIDSAGSTPHPHTPAASSFMTRSAKRSETSGHQKSLVVRSLAVSRSEGPTKRSRSNSHDANRGEERLSPVQAAAGNSSRGIHHRKSELDKLLEACPESIRADISPKSRPAEDARESVAERVAARPRAFVCDYTYWEKDLVMRTTKRQSGRGAEAAVLPSLPPPAPAARLVDPALDASSRQRPAKKGRLEGARKQSSTNTRKR